MVFDICVSQLRKYVILENWTTARQRQMAKVVSDNTKS